MLDDGGDHGGGLEGDVPGRIGHRLGRSARLTDRWSGGRWHVGSMQQTEGGAKRFIPS